MLKGGKNEKELFIFSGLAYIGGGVAAIEKPVVVPVVVDESAFYVGLGFGQATY